MAKAPTSNEYRHYITFQSRTKGATDAHGQRALAWSDVRSVWSKLEVKTASETVGGDRKVQVSKFIFTIRNIDGVLPSMRILHRTRFYSIDSVYDKEGLGKHITIEATFDDSKNLSSEVV